MAIRKAEGADLKGWYPLYVQIGMIAALGLLIVALKVNLQKEEGFEIPIIEQQIVEMEDVEQTKQEVKPPPPPRPPTPVEVPNDEELEDNPLDVPDSFLDIDEPLANLPPPPPPPSEEEDEEEPEYFVIVEEKPELIGGLAGLQKKIRYPEVAKKAGLSGRVFVQFIVDEDGNVIDPVVTRGAGLSLDEEALRVVSQAKFKPGKQRGQAVRVKMSLPITFKLK